MFNSLRTARFTGKTEDRTCLYTIPPYVLTHRHSQSNSLSLYTGNMKASGGRGISREGTRRRQVKMK
jgi:hypothetical protein